MRLPRDVSGLQLCKRLEPLGYRVTRQKGSHRRLTTTKNGEHHVTILVRNFPKLTTGKNAHPTFAFRTLDILVRRTLDILVRADRPPKQLHPSPRCLNER